MQLSSSVRTGTTSKWFATNPRPDASIGGTSTIDSSLAAVPDVKREWPRTQQSLQLFGSEHRSGAWCTYAGSPASRADHAARAHPARRPARGRDESAVPARRHRDRRPRGRRRGAAPPRVRARGACRLRRRRAVHNAVRLGLGRLRDVRASSRNSCSTRRRRSSGSTSSMRGSPRGCWMAARYEFAFHRT